MIYRSLLFVPGDSERKIAKALDTSADAVVLDLEDAVTPENHPMARELISKVLSESDPGQGTHLWVRVNPVASEDNQLDLDAVVVPGLAGVMVPKPDSAADIEKVAAYLDELEKKTNLPSGSVNILSVMTETPAAFLNAASYNCNTTKRLAGVLWGAEDLSAALGAIANTDADGELSFTYRMARSFCLTAAAATESQPIDTVYTDFKNADGLTASCHAARREGFLGKIAIHPDQVDIINATFTPTDEELAYARAVIKTFEDNPSRGTVGLDGKMLDRPHFVKAQRLLSMAKDFNL